MSKENAIHYIVRRNGQDTTYLHIEDAIAAAKGKLKDYPGSTYYVFTAGNKVQAVEPACEVTSLWYDWNINCKKSEAPASIDSIPIEYRTTL